ncbi:leucine-rich repeat protein, partial [Ruminococcus sp.]|uniref:leucine-rich repeat protein n=1 Tax=Ruminococcus sp. TaxID=41978 RepID=UPI0025D6AFA7
MKHLKITSVLLSAAICMSFVMTPVMVTADETEVPEQTTEAAEAPETKETEATKETEKAKEPEVTEPSESVSETTETEPSVQNKENEEIAHSESDPETTETEPSEVTSPEESRVTEPSKSSEPSEKEAEAEPSEPETASRKPLANWVFSGGACGIKATWSFHGYGSLIISGSGDMSNYDNDSPWGKYSEDITDVTVIDGITSIGTNSFNGCKNIEYVSIPKSVTLIKKDAFTGCTGIKEINYGGTAQDWSKIDFGSGTNPFKNAVIRYNAVYHNLSVNNDPYGKITLSKYSAVEGETITVTAKPNEGYYLFAVKVDNALWRGNSFTMGNKDVVVTPDFRTIYQSPVGDIKRDSDGMRYKITNNAINGTGTVECIGFYIDPGIDESVLAKAFAVANIPAAVKLDGVVYKATVIGSNAFRDNKYVKTVSIGSNVVVIGNNAFFGCVNLTKVYGGARVKTIGANAFARCTKLS